MEFIRKHGIKIAAGTALIIAAGFGAAYFFPVAAATALTAVATAGTRVKNAVIGFFRRKPVVTEVIVETPVPTAV